MWLDRRIGVLAFAVLTLAGCGGGAAPEGGPGTTYDYVDRGAPARVPERALGMRGHSLTSLAYEYGTNGPTVVAAARSWAR